jgi:SAM-dependent methyltransferase
VLDEATSALDAGTESAILDTLDRIAVGRTLVMITHRLTSAMRCDRILVLAEGQLVEAGTHAELMDHRGLYWRLVMDSERSADPLAPPVPVIDPRRLARVPLFARLNADDLAGLGARLTIEHYPSGGIIVRQGEPADRLFVVGHGRVEVVREDAEPLRVNVLTAGSYFGEVALLGDSGARRTASVLDMCCGHGRHSLELARRGYRVTGVDRNQAFIEAAATDARNAGVDVDWQVADMREFVPQHPYDAVLNLFFAWGYLESEAADRQALGIMANALGPGGQLVIEYQNRELVLQHIQRTWRWLASGDVLLREFQFEPSTSRLSGAQIVIRASGERVERRFDLRLYTCTELLQLLMAEGLTPTALYGSYGGEAFGLQSPMLLVIAHKNG